MPASLRGCVERTTAGNMLMANRKDGAQSTVVGDGDKVDDKAGSVNENHQEAESMFGLLPLDLPPEDARALLSGFPERSWRKFCEDAR